MPLSAARPSRHPHTGASLRAGHGALLALLCLWLVPVVALGQSSPPPGFAQTDSGCLPDGGLCLVPPEHQSEPVTVSLSVGARRIGIHPNTIYGTGRAEIIAPDGRVLMALSDSLLHGHEFFNPKPPIPYFNYREGTFQDRFQRFQSVCQAAGYRPESCVTRLTYRYATSDTRWERTAVTDTLDVSWWNVVPNADRDYQPLLAHILNVARLRRSADPGSATVILFPACGDYGYYGSLVVPDGVTLAGVGGTVLAEETDDLGNTYRPVRLVECPTRLLALPNTAAEWAEARKGRPLPAGVPASYPAKIALRSVQTAIYAAPRARALGLQDLVLDGNVAGQERGYRLLKSEEDKNIFRNTPTNVGFAVHNQNGVEVDTSAVVVVENVGITGYSAPLLAAGEPQFETGAGRWTLRNVRLGDAPLGHLVYCTDGDWTNVTLTGFSWHAGVTCPRKGPDGKPVATMARNLVVVEGKPNIFRQPFDGLLSFRGSAVKIDGFYFDLRGSGYQRPFNGRADRLWARNGVVLFDDKPSPGLYSGNSNGLFFDDVEVFLNGDVQYLVGRGRKNVVGFRNVRVRDLPGTKATLVAVLAAGASGPGPLVFVDDLDLEVPLKLGFANVHGKRASPSLRLCADTAVQGVAPNVPAAECAELRARYLSALPAPSPR